MESKGPAEAVGPEDARAAATVPSAWPEFSIARLPRILFGSGRSRELPAVVVEFGTRALVVVRGPDFTESPDWARLRRGLESAGVSVAVEAVSGEPSPAIVDEIMARHRGSGSESGGSTPRGLAPIDVVVGIGGGSVL
ncbi:MAG: iron-containing alcohol dehydrogenase, partial [Candidatus Limnocylindrales bacterium]